MSTLLEAEPVSTSQATAPSTQRIVLTGFMGAGKSTVGRLLAAQLGWNFVDIDAAIEEHRGCTVAEIFAKEGEAVFRRHESSAIAKALGQAGVVIALGGGAPEVLRNRLLLEQTANTAVVFLDAPFEVLFDRCVLQEGAAVRPVLMDADAAAHRFRQRTPHYRRCALIQIATEEQTPTDTVAELLKRLHT